MLTEIVTRLQTGSISNVVMFGSPLPSSPYVCVKPEVNDIGRQLRIIVHYDLGNNDALDLYIFNELPDLLSNWSYTDEYGNYVTVKDSKEYTDIVADNDDSTISMERLFYIPLIL
jgi:hypothetical protein